MNRCSPVEMRKNLIIVDQFKNAGTITQAEWDKQNRYVLVADSQTRIGLMSRDANGEPSIVLGVLVDRELLEQMVRAIDHPDVCPACGVWVTDCKTDCKLAALKRELTK